MSGGDVPNGSLLHWADVAVAERWQVLLLGNGLSVNVWPRFGYSRLLDHATAASLTDVDKALFGEHTNFERVLSDLSTAIRVNEIAGVPTRPLYARYRNIQVALGHAVREVHPNRSALAGEKLATLRRVLARFEWVFTTSYDLLVYWAIGHGGSYRPFKDHFQYAGRCQFDPKRADVFQGEIPVYYLHGALHLVVGGMGETWKLRLTSLQTILDQFGQPIEGDPRARPLLVTEGSAREKLRAIESNTYLAHALAPRERGVSYGGLRQPSRRRGRSPRRRAQREPAADRDLDVARWHEARASAGSDRPLGPSRRTSALLLRRHDAPSRRTRPSAATVDSAPVRAWPYARR